MTHVVIPDSRRTDLENLPTTGRLAIVWLHSNSEIEHHGFPVLVQCWSNKLKVTGGADRVEREDVIAFQMVDWH